MRQRTGPEMKNLNKSHSSQNEKKNLKALISHSFWFFPYLNASSK